MCNKDRCLFCIPVQHGCLAFGIISAFVSALGFVGSIITGVLFYLEIILDLRPTPEHPGDAQTAAANAVAKLVIWFAVVVGTVGFLIAFIFSALLCHGICKRHLGHVNAYMYYGMAITVLTAMFSVAALFLAETCTPGLLGLAGCAIYCLVLLLVHHTYEKLRAGAPFKERARLMED